MNQYIYPYPKIWWVLISSPLSTDLLKWCRKLKHPQWTAWHHPYLNYSKICQCAFQLMPSLNGIFPHYHTMGKLLSECLFLHQSPVTKRIRLLIGFILVPCQLAIAKEEIASLPHQLQLGNGVLHFWLDCQSSSSVAAWWWCSSFVTWLPVLINCNSAYGVRPFWLC